jgi:hypothetical protein
MYSIDNRPWIAALFAALDEASTRGATHGELMDLFDSFDRLRREVTATGYELTSPFPAPRRGGPT